MTRAEFSTGWRDRLRTIVDNRETFVGRTFDTVIYILIIVSLILFALETLPELAAFERQFLLLEWITVGLFSAEYVARVFSAVRPFGYIFSFFGLVDLAAILPTYLSFGLLDLRSLRALRLVRLLRVAKMTRYGSAWINLRNAFSEIKYELAVYLGITFLLIYLAAVGIYYCERDAQPEAFRSVFHSMWWAVVTLSTVGYGDVFPITLWGRVFTFFVLLVGVSIVAVPSGLLASALVRAKDAADE